MNSQCSAPMCAGQFILKDSQAEDMLAISDMFFISRIAAQGIHFIKDKDKIRMLT